jgi:hypothetical protein
MISSQQKEIQDKIIDLVEKFKKADNSIESLREKTGEI